MRLVTPQAPPRPLTFPLGAQTRCVDASGRLKFSADSAPSHTLGWRPGALVVVNPVACLTAAGGGRGFIAVVGALAV